MESESARDAAVNRRESARQTLLTMGLTPGEVDEIFKSGQTRTTLPIRVPIKGMVVRFDKVLGQGVASNEPLFEIHDLSHPLAKGYLSESLAPQVKIGSPARVRLLSDPSFLANGKVVRSARMLNAESRTLAVWIEFDGANKLGLHRNLLTRITATIGQPAPLLAVPLTAIIREQSRSYVFVQKKDGLLERRLIEVGRSDDRFAEVKNGLALGETIVVHGTAELQTTYASVR
jgi:RND family efflux transporter MFP subunit